MSFCQANKRRTHFFQSNFVTDRQYDTTILHISPPITPTIHYNSVIAKQPRQAPRRHYALEPAWCLSVSVILSVSDCRHVLKLQQRWPESCPLRFYICFSNGSIVRLMQLLEYAPQRWKGFQTKLQFVIWSVFHHTDLKHVRDCYCNIVSMRHKLKRWSRSPGGGGRLEGEAADRSMRQ